MSKLINNLPNLIREWLAADKEHTQKILADRAKLDEATLSRIINSSRAIIDLDKAERIREVIGFSIADLIIEVPDMPYDRSKRNVN